MTESDSVAASPPSRLYVLFVCLSNVFTKKWQIRKKISREIEIRGDQTLEQLHEVIFKAYDRWEEHLYEFHLGKHHSISMGPFSASQTKTR